MNIPYLCGSAKLREYAMRNWMNDNRTLVDRADYKGRRATLKSGITVFFHTYDRPDVLRGMEFVAVFRDNQRVEATMAEREATEAIVLSRLR